MAATPRSETGTGHHKPAERRNEELLKAATCARDKRTPQQLLKISAWVSSLPEMHRLSPGALHGLMQHLYPLELHLGHTLYRAGDPADWFYLVLDGSIVLTDARDADDGSDPEVGLQGPNTCFGEEEILCGSRRAFTATAADLTVTMLRLPMVEYKKVLEDIHAAAFEAKVAFLSSLAPIKPLKDEVVRKLSPCFSVVQFRKGDIVVRQGDKADAMYAIRAGTCGVLVDPHFKDTSEGLGEIDPKKTVQVVTLEAGAIIGDVTVLAKLHKRTATVIVQSQEVACYKIRRATFLRRLPADQLEILRRLAAEKLKLMDQKIKSQPTHKNQNQILQGHNLRQLMFQQSQGGTGQEHPEEYQQLLQVLRRYKRSAAPPSAPRGAPATFMAQHARSSSSPTRTPAGGWDYPGINSGGTRGGTLLAGALRATITAGNGPTANLVPELREHPPPPASPRPHADWRYLEGGRDPALTDGSVAMKAALLRMLPADPYASFHTGASQTLNASAQGMYWRPISPRRCGHPQNQSPSRSPRDTPGTPHEVLAINYHHRPFIASVTLKTLAQPPDWVDPDQYSLTLTASPPMPSSPARSQMVASHLDSRAQTSHTFKKPTSHGSRPDSASAWSSTALWRNSPAAQAGPGLGQWSHPTHYALDFHTDPDSQGTLNPSNSSSSLSSSKEASKLEGVLEALSRPLMEARPGATVVRRGTAHFRPTIPKAML